MRGRDFADSQWEGGVAGWCGAGVTAWAEGGTVAARGHGAAVATAAGRDVAVGGGGSRTGPAGDGGAAVAERGRQVSVGGLEPLHGVAESLTVWFRPSRCPPPASQCPLTVCASTAPSAPLPSGPRGSTRGQETQVEPGGPRGPRAELPSRALSASRPSQRILQHVHRGAAAQGRPDLRGPRSHG